MGYINNNIGNSSGNSNYSLEAQDNFNSNLNNSSSNSLSARQSYNSTDSWKSQDHDNFINETYQAVLGQPLSMRMDTWDKTFFGGETELNDHLGYTMWDKSWQEQDGWERTETVVDTVSGGVTWAGIGMIAAGGLLTLTGVGAEVGIPLMYSGATSVGYGVGGKAILSHGIGTLSGIATKTMKARGVLSDTSFLEKIGNATEKADVQDILSSTFKTEEYDGVLSNEAIDGLSDILAKETNTDSIKNQLDYTLEHDFNSNSKALLDELKIAGENEELRLGANAVLETNEKRFWKGTAVEKINDEFDKINGGFDKKVSNLSKDTAYYDEALKDLSKTEIDYNDWKIASNRGESQLVKKFIEDKIGIETEFKIVSSELEKMQRRLNSLEDVKDIKHEIEVNPFLTKEEKAKLQSELKIDNIKEQYQLEKANKQFNQRLKEFKDKRTATKKAQIEKSADRINAIKDKMYNKRTDFVTKLQDKVWGSAIKQLDKATKLDELKYNKLSTAKKQKLATERAKLLKKTVKEKYSKSFKSMARRIESKVQYNKAMSMIAKMEDVGNAADVKSYLEKVIGKQFEKAFLKEQKFITKTKQRAFKQIIKDNGKVDKLIKYFENKANVWNIDADSDILELKAMQYEGRGMNLDAMSPVELEQFTNKFLDRVDRVKVKILNSSKNSAFKLHITDEIADMQATIIKNNDYGHVREVFEGTGIRNFLKRAMHSLGTNGNHYDILDKTALENSPLKQIFFAPQLEAKNKVDRVLYKFRSTADNIIKEHNLGVDEFEKITIYSILRRAPKTVEELRANRKWLIEDEKAWPRIQTLFKELKLDETDLRFKFDGDWEKHLDDLKVNKPKQYEKLGDINLAKEAYLKERLLGHLSKYLDYNIKNAKGTKATGIRAFIKLSDEMMATARADELEILKTFDKDKKVEANIAGYFAPMPLIRKKGVDTFLLNKEYSITQNHLTPSGHKMQTSVKNKTAGYAVQKTANSDFELHYDPVAMVEKGLHKSVSYSNFRPVEHQIKKVLLNTEDVLGKKFGDFVKNEVFTNYNEGIIRQKSEMDVLLDKLSRNAVYGILAFKMSTPIAQLTAVPEFIATFRSPKDGIRAWMQGSKYVGKYDKNIEDFFSAVSPEYIERTDKIMNNAGSMAKTIIGSGEINNNVSGISKYSSKGGRAYDVFKTASLAPIKLVDKALYKNAFVGVYLHKLELAGYDISDIGSIFNKNNPALKVFADEAAQQLAEGMGSFSMVNKSMFLKTGQLGNLGADGSMQSWVRAFTIMQSFVYNSMYRMYNNGMVKPSKLWAAGDKGAAVQQATTSIMMEFVGKAMYVENLERVHRMQEVLTGGDYDDPKFEQDSTIDKLASEYFGHIPVVSSIGNTFTYSETAGIPSHIDGVLGAAKLMFDTTLGDKTVADISRRDMRDFRKAMFTAFGVPLNEPMDMLYKYEKNHAPEIEKDKSREWVARQQVTKDNVNVVEWAVERPGEKILKNGRWYSVADILSSMKRLEPKRYKKLERQIKLKTKYGDIIDDAEKLIKLNNTNKAKFILSKQGAEQGKWLTVMEDLGLLTKDFKKKLIMLKNSQK